MTFLLQSPVPLPTGWTPGEIAAWVVGILVFLAGGGLIGKAYLQRSNFFNEREKASWERIKERLDDQATVIAEQEERLERQSHKIEDHFVQLEELQKKQFDERLQTQRQILEYQKGLFEEREANKSIRDMFEFTTRKLQECQERDTQKEVQILEIKDQVRLCEQRDAAKAQKLSELEHEVIELRHRVDSAQI